MKRVIYLSLLLSLLGCGKSNHSRLVTANASVRYQQDLDQDFVNTCKVGYVAPKINPRVVDPIAAQVKTIFDNNCIKCHGLGATTGSPKIKNIEDANELRTSGIVNVANPPASDLYFQITAGTPRMPLGSPPLKDADIASILTWIQQGAKPLVDVPVTPPPAKFITPATEEACIAANLGGIDRTLAPSQRFFSGVSTYNTGGDMKQLRWAVDKAVNSVSRVGFVTRSVPIGNPAVIFRIDLNSYALNFNAWERVLLPFYPYGINFFAEQGTNEAETTTDERFIQKITGSGHAWVNAAWGAQQLMTPGVYYVLLAELLRNNVNDLFRRGLGIDEGRDIENLTDRRIGFAHSGVTNFNRLIDYHPFVYNFGGIQNYASVYRTFDSESNSDFRNFFEFPFGPAGTFPTKFVHTFQFDASEIIGDLPNGLHFYVLYNGKGQRINEAITQVAFDPGNLGRFIGDSPGVISDPTSCMKCHASGMNYATDEVRAIADKTTAFSKFELDEVDALFADKKEFDGILANTIRTYAAAMNNVVPNNKDVLSPLFEPIWTNARDYAADVTVARAGAEIGLPTDEFKRCMIHSPVLASALGLTDLDKGVIQRAVWEKFVGDAMKECDIGLQLRFRGTETPTRPTGFTTIYNHSSAGFSFNLGYSGKQFRKELQPGESTVLTEHLDCVFSSTFMRVDGSNRVTPVVKNYTLADGGSYEISVRDGNLDLFSVVQ